MKNAGHLILTPAPGTAAALRLERPALQVLLVSEWGG